MFRESSAQRGLSEPFQNCAKLYSQEALAPLRIAQFKRTIMTSAETEGVSASRTAANGRIAVTIASKRSRGSAIPLLRHGEWSLTCIFSGALERKNSISEPQYRACDIAHARA